MKRHMRENYFVTGEGILTFDDEGNPIRRSASTVAEIRKFRFSRLGDEGAPVDNELRLALAQAMVEGPAQDSPIGVPAGFTYLGQFVDHDLTMDRTAAAFDTDVTVDELLQGRSPALDLDSLYGRGPQDRDDRRFYADDGTHLRTGTTAAVAGDPRTNVDLQGFDLPRVGLGSSRSARRKALIPDLRNDENLAVAQTHLAFIRFHNRVVDTLAARGLSGRTLFEAARRSVVQHYQWMLRTDFLPRIVKPEIVDDVFTNGRRFFEVSPGYGTPPGRHTVRPGDRPTMPLEFSVAAYRFGHSMIRESYEWNRVFNSQGIVPGLLTLLFNFSGTSGTLSPGTDADNDPDEGSFEVLPTNWVADFRRLFDFREAGRDDLFVGAEELPVGGIKLNLTRRVDTSLVDPLKLLPLGSFGSDGAATVQRNLAFRNLTRANMVRLASGRQMAALLDVAPLKDDEIITGNGGVDLGGLDPALRGQLLAATPLWFYVLREAEFNNGLLNGVGGRIVAEVFHRAMEGSRTSLVRDPSWRPSLGEQAGVFRMVDLLLFAFEHDADLLNPLG